MAAEHRFATNEPSTNEPVAELAALAEHEQPPSVVGQQLDFLVRGARELARAKLDGGSPLKLNVGTSAPTTVASLLSLNKVTSVCSGGAPPRDFASSSTVPLGLQQPAQAGREALAQSPALPPGWTAHTDAARGRQFYVSSWTGHAQWERPCFPADEIPTRSSR